MKTNIEIKFPCGYEANVKIETSYFDFFYKFELERAFEICPLHGKDCYRIPKPDIVKDTINEIANNIKQDNEIVIVKDKDEEKPDSNTANDQVEETEEK